MLVVAFTKNSFDLPVERNTLLVRDPFTIFKVVKRLEKETHWYNLHVLYAPSEALRGLLSMRFRLPIETITLYGELLQYHSLPDYIRQCDPTFLFAERRYISPDIRRHLAVLGFTGEPPPSIEKIHKKYRQQCLRLHPDKGGTTDQFVQLQQSYEALLCSNLPCTSSSPPKP